MLRKIIIYIVCYTMAWTTVLPAYAQSVQQPTTVNESTLRTLYPDAKIIHVSEQDYPALQAQLRAKGYQLAQAGTPPVDDSDAYVNPPSSLEETDCGNRKYKGNEPGEEALRFSIDFTKEMMDSGGHGKSDDRGAAIVFVVVGTIILFVWTLYVFQYLYDISTGNYQCKWNEFSYTSTSIYSTATQYAFFQGVQYQTGAQYGNSDFGLSFELGYSDIKLTDIGTLRLTGLYWFVGPMLRWRMTKEKKNPDYLQMSFRAGSTEHAEMGLIAQVKVGYRIGLSENAYMSVSWGAMNLKLKETQGLISDTNQFYYIYGVNVGYQF